MHGASPGDGVAGADAGRQDGLGRDADEHAEPVRPVRGGGVDRGGGTECRINRRALRGGIAETNER